MSKIINVGRVTSYADAVAGGYTGTREEWEIILANLGTTAAEVEANRQAVAEDKAAVEGDVTTVGEYKDAAARSASDAAQSAASAHTDALAATAAKEAAQTAQGLANEARADAVNAKTAAESAQSEADTSASSAAGSALVAQDAAATAAANAGAASDSATAAAQSAAAAAESARTLTIDTTLTQAGQAADAKKVGDEVTDLKSAIYETAEDTHMFDDTWGRYTIGQGTTGDLIGTTGQRYDASTIRIATYPVQDISGVTHIVISPDSGYKVLLNAYNANLSSVVRAGTWDTETISYIVPDNVKYIVILIAKTDNTTITTAEYTHATITTTVTTSAIDDINTEINDINNEITTIKSNINTDNQTNRIEELIESGNLISGNEYELLEYIETATGNSNTVKIDTGLTMGPTLRTEIDMQLTKIDGNNYMGREGVNGYSVRNAIGINPGISPTQFYFGFGNENLALGSLDTNRHVFYIDVPKLKYGYDNIAAEKSAFTYGAQYANYKIYLLGVAVTAMESYVKLYRARYYDNGVLIAYFVPVMRLSDGKSGLYDVVRDEFYTNSGNGTIKPGRKTTSSDAELDIDKSAKADTYSSYFNGSGVIGTYLYFTDPHIYNKNVTKDIQDDLFRQLSIAYNSTPTDFIMCGGDWLQGGSDDVIPDGPTQVQACAQLGYVDGVMHKLFCDYKPIFGNHDGNYKNTALSQQTINNLMFRAEGKSYYKFIDNGVAYYVFDTGLDNNNTLNSFRKEQCTWFANSLAEETAEHIVICCHIFVNTSSGVWSNAVMTDMGNALTATAAAYNAKNASYTASWDSSVVCDYSSATGTVDYVIAGHIHHDWIVQGNGIPAILVTNALAAYTTPTFDAVFADYDGHVVKTQRFGNGGNRIVHLGQTIVSSATSLTPTITPSSWTSSDTSVATVSNGTVSPVSAGYALITAADTNGNAESWVVSAQ